MDSVVKLELGVQMTCHSCEEAVKKVLVNVAGVKSVAVDLGKEQVVVETSLPSEQIINIIESTGKKAVILGVGSDNSHTNFKQGDGLAAAVAMMSGIGSAQGVIRLVQVDSHSCVIDGTIDGLTPGKHQLNIHEFGDLSDNCENCGDVFKIPFSKSSEKEGELGIVEANASGRAMFRLQTNKIPISDLIGRSMVIHEGPKRSERIACGIIARSSGLFENSKRICACDGISLWNERDVPIAGASRQTKGKVKL